MEIIDNELLAMIADFEDQVMRDEAEETMFDQSMRRWEIGVALDDLWGG
jgi:hypothetical protein